MEGLEDIVDRMMNWQKYYQFVCVFKEHDLLRAWKVEVIDGENMPDKTTTYDVIQHDDDTGLPEEGLYPSIQFHDVFLAAGPPDKDGALPSMGSKEELWYLGDKTKH